MLNIYYNPSYFTNVKGKILLTRRAEYSIFIHLLIRCLYLFNLPSPEWIIKKGPQRRINHLISTYKKNNKINFNSNKFTNNYIVQFDSFGEKILKEIIKKHDYSTKVIVGPLFNYQWDKILNEYIEEYPFIKKLVASDAALEAQRIMHKNIDLNNILVCPSGVGRKEEIKKNLTQKEPIYDCLIYFKKRDIKELEMVIDLLNVKGLTYNVLIYGKYKSQNLDKLAEKSKFGIILNKTESQGFAIQRLMSKNLPLIVWDYQLNLYEGFKIKSTSVPLWNDSQCGIKVSSFKDIDINFDNFIQNLENYNPVNFILENLTYENFEFTLNSFFQNKKLWTI